MRHQTSLSLNSDRSALPRAHRLNSPFPAALALATPNRPAAGLDVLYFECMQWNLMLSGRFTHDITVLETDSEKTGIRFSANDAHEQKLTTPCVNISPSRASSSFCRSPAC